MESDNTMKNHLHIVTLFSSMLLAPLAHAAGQSSGKPNILFLFADDQRADTIAALGNPDIRTPNLDRLVKSGLAFNRAYMQGGLNGATCVPSRAMLLSGRTLFHIDEGLVRDETWPAAFGRAGYTTFVTGKWHNGVTSVPRSFQIARSMFTGGMSDPMKAPLTTFANGIAGQPEISRQHACAVFVDETLRFLKEHKDGPFFAYIPFDAPHDPHIVPEDFPIHYDAAKIPLPPDFLPYHPWDNGEMTIRDEKLLPWPRPPEQVRALIADYYRYISYLDSQIGRILDALAASPYAKNTIVVFCADSGVARGGHGLIGKQNLYEHSMRVPLVISGPGIPAGMKTDAMCYLFDVMPTLGKLCEVAAPTTSDGIAFTPTLQDPGKPARSQLMFAYKNVQRAVRDERWKLIRYPLIDRTQLFDLSADPHEVNNLADKPEHAGRIANLTALLEKEMRHDGDTAPLTVGHPKPAEWSPPGVKRLTSSNRSKANGNRKAEPPPAYAATVPKPTLSEVRYGPHARNFLDFWKADSDHPTPLAFVIHGGAWKAGTKERVSGFVDVSELLKAGISVAAINYRYTTQAADVMPPVKVPMDDCARALQFVRSKAGEWNLDKSRVGAAGGSAGACSSLWLAFHDDLADPKSPDPIARESTRLKCAAVTGAQTSLDPQQMKAWTPNSSYGGHAFGFGSFNEFLAGRETILPWIAGYSPYALVTADDPPVYLIYTTPPALGKPQKDPTHTSNFGVKLWERCTTVKVPCELVYPGAKDVKHATPTGYLIEALKTK
jgi:arylsulfatase A-like enzyme